jgi:Peptidase C39 family
MNRVLRMAMSVDLSTQQLHEPVVSCDTALSCLIRLRVCNGDDPEVEAVRHLAVLDGNTLPASRLIELVGKFGLQAECVRLDWDGLTKAELGHPILVFLKNTNVVVVTGAESAATEAVSIWDPLHSDGEVLTVPREDFERAWSGDALAITRQPSPEAEALSGFPGQQDIEGPAPPLETHSERAWSGDALAITRQPSLEAEASSGLSGQQDAEVPDPPLETDSERTPIAETEPPPISVTVARRAKSQWLLAIGLVAAAALSVPLLLHAVTDSAGRTGIRAKEETPEVPRSTAEATARSLEPVAAASAPARPMPPVAPSAAMPALSESIGRPAAAVAQETAAPAPEPTSSASPAQAEPPAGPAVAAAPAAPIPSYEVSTAAPSTDPISSAEPRLSAPEIATLLARGDVLFGTGDLAAARTFYERAADAGDAQAAVRLGETYDPSFLDRAHLRGVRGNVVTALAWYRRARDLGAAEAEVLLNSLEAK